MKMGWSRKSPKKEGNNVKLSQFCLRSQNSAICAPGLLQIMQMKQKDGCGGQKQSGQEEATRLGREQAPVLSILVQEEAWSSHFRQSLTSLHRITTPSILVQEEAWSSHFRQSLTSLHRITTPSILVQAEGRSSHFSQSLTSFHRIPTPNRVFQHLITHLQQTHHRQ